MVSAGTALLQPIDLHQRIQNREALTGAIACVPPVSAALADADPYSARFSDLFSRSMHEALAAHWPTVRSTLSGLSEDSALRHAWALCRTALEFAALYRSVLEVGSDPAKRLALSLRDLTFSKAPQDTLARAVAFGAESPPDLTLDHRIKPGLRLRYALAARFLNGVPPQDLIEAAQQIEGATPYVRRRELLRLLESPHARTTSLQLDPIELALLSPGAQNLLMTSDRLIEAFIPNSLGRGTELSAWISATRVRRARLEKKAQRILSALDVRDHAQLNRLLSTLELDPLSRAVCSRARLQLESNPAVGPDSDGVDDTVPASGSGGKDLGKWAPMSDMALAKLRALFPQIRVSSHWSLTAPSVADALCSGSLSIKALTRRDLERLRTTWSASAQARLLAAGIHAALDSSAAAWLKLPLRRLAAIASSRRDFVEILAKRLSARLDAAEVLALLRANRETGLRRQVESALRQMASPRTLDELVLPWIGTDRWARAGGWGLHDDEIKDALMEVVDRRVAAVDRDRFAKAAARALARLSEPTPRQRRRQSPNEPSPHELAIRLALRDKSVQQELVRVAPLPWLQEYVKAATGHKSLLASLARTGPDDLQPSVHATRLAGANSAAELLPLLADGARRGDLPPWNPRWTRFASDDGSRSVDGLTCLVIALRNDLKRLKRIAAGVPDDEMRAALGQAASILKESTGRTQPLLELASLLGISTTPALAGLMGRIRPGDPPGHRLNGAYLKWTLPKKAGGTRQISAPDRQLMVVQRAILSKLLTPLGAHPAACGFVKGRSIKDNASPHVGRQIVANADVENCFPSVKWPLVLAALQRDLGSRLSPPALQLLVDLCTAEGGLPIGAPTSPALLNRVMLRTDEILTEAAARRDCVYTRYADDLSFSGNHGAVELLGVAKGTLHRIGLELDPRKTNIFRRGRRQVCTGLVVNEQVSVPRRVRRRLRAAVHAAEMGRTTTWHGKPQSDASLRGRLAFVRMIHPEEGMALAKRLKTATVREESEGDSDGDD